MTTNRRILIGKPGLDGHDRGAKYVAQVLRDAGFEVIYTGIRRTPEQIACAAVQEDVAAMGLSLLSGAHLNLFGRVLELMRAADAADVPIFGGGVIPEADCRQLQAQGVAALFTPGTPAEQIVQTIEALLAAKTSHPSADVLAEQLADESLSAARRTRAAARLITLLENEPGQSARVGQLLAAAAGHARAPLVLGVTGAPGSGKSTLAAALVQALHRRRPQDRIGVVAVDPSSPVTGGALLGDRVRMMHLADHAGVFIRSLASRGQLGGLSPTVPAAVSVLGALGCGTILLETVGVGQNEAAVTALAERTMLVLAPGQGDDIQMLKAGILELADIIVINKADQPTAGILHQQVLQARQVRRRVHVALVSAVDGQGIAELLDHLDQTAAPFADGHEA